jgi:hypothetical protein
MDLMESKSVQEREGTRFASFTAQLTIFQDLVSALLASLPRSSLLTIQKKIVPLLQLDVVGVRPSSSSPNPPL